MTGHQINSLVGDLVAMAQAMEKLPHVEAENARLQQASIADGERIARLELRLQERNEEIASLHQRIAEVTKERDDFGFRHLEEVDKTNALLLAIRNATGSLSQSVNVVDPPKVEPKAEDHKPVDEPHPFGDHGGGTSQLISGNSNGDPGMGERVADPIVHVASTESTVGNSSEGSSSVASAEKLSEGQSEPLPTSSASSQKDDSNPSVSESVILPEPVHSAEPLPYSGKRYYDEPGTISRERWLALGGTNESYDWRPWAQGETKAHG